MRNYKVALCQHCIEEKQIIAKGYCRACYTRLQKTGSLEYKRKGIRSICTENECNDYVVSNGLCDKHRKRLARYGQTKTLRPDDWGKREKHPLYVYWSDTKRRETLNIYNEWVNDFWSFVECVKVRPSKNHYLRAVDINKILGPDNWQWVEGITEANRKILNREKGKSNDRKRLRISAEERAGLLLKAEYKCEICKAELNNSDCPVTGSKSSKSLCIDHCHETGRIRGVLCTSCNVALGHFKDDISLLNKAIVYLSGNS